MANNAPAKDIKGTPRVKLRPTKIPMTAPKADPLETPRMKGSARGFRSKAWKTTPLNESEKPTIPASRILGSLILKIISRTGSSASSLPDKRSMA